MYAQAAIKPNTLLRGIFCEDSLDIMQNWQYKTETGSFGIEMSRFLYVKKKYFSCNHFCNRVI